MEYSPSPSQESKPRRSPPPLVSVHDSPRRGSLVGLQRLVYSSQIFSSPGRGLSPNTHSVTETGDGAMADSEQVPSKTTHLVNN